MNPYREAGMWFLTVGMAAAIVWLVWEIRHPQTGPDDMDLLIRRLERRGRMLLERDKAIAEWKRLDREGQK